MDLLLNRIPVSEVSLDFPRIGVWAGDALVSSDHSFSLFDEVQLKVDEIIYQGTIIAISNDEGLQKIRIVGGKGGLSFPPKYSRNMKDIKGKDIIDGFIKDASENLGYIAPEIANYENPNFQTFNSIPIGVQLSHFLRRFNDSFFRIAPNGSVQIGFESENNVKINEQNMTKIQSAGDGSICYSFNLWDREIHPGMIIDGFRIERMTVNVSNQGLAVWFFRSDPYRNPHIDELKHVLSASYPATIVTQNADGVDGKLGGTLQVIPDDPLIRGGGMDKLRIRGLPGVYIRVPDGQRCSVSFDAQDAGRPYISGFLGEPEPGKLDQTTDNFCLVLGNPSNADFVSLDELVQNNLSEIKSAIASLVWDFNAHVHGKHPTTGEMLPPIPSEASYSPSPTKNKNFKVT